MTSGHSRTAARARALQVRRARARQVRRRRRVALSAVAAVAIGAVLGTQLIRGEGKRDASAKSRSAQAPRQARPTVQLAPPGPIPGYLLIADRGNNRMLLVDGAKRIYWRYPKPNVPVAMPFRFDDDTFFGPRSDRIISNQEDQHTIQIISFPGGRVLWRYGHVNVKGAAPGYLNTPDDAYLLKNGLVTVADAYNCRVIFISPAHRIVRQYGASGSCVHNPPAQLGAVNGATPLPGGGTLVSEINGSWIDNIAPTGRLRWAVRAPVSYPSDPQLLGPNRILLADYANPGQALIMTRSGRVVWRYGPTSGPGALNHPSLATRISPDLIAINDDFRARVVLVSIRQHRIVWQYGHTDLPGTGPGYLNTPDGLDLLPTAAAQASSTLRTLLSAAPGSVARAPAPAVRAGIGVSRAGFELPAPVEREVGVAYAGGIVLAGGLDAGGVSTKGVFRLDPASGRISLVGSVPQPFHDAAGALLDHRLFVFGGGSAQSSASVQTFDLATGRGAVAGRLPRALSDLVSARVGRSIYLVGGYDGSRPRAEIYRTTDGLHFEVAGRLPIGLRYPAVAAVGSTLVVAGGVGGGGPTPTVYAFDTQSGRSRVVGRLPVAVGHASAIAFADTVYVLGGQDAAGHASAAASRIELRTGSVTSVNAPLPVSDAAVIHVGSHALLVGGARSGRATTAVYVVRSR